MNGERTIEVASTSPDPWFDLWTARIVSKHGRVLGKWRVPFAPPYSLRYDAVDRVVLGRIEFCDHDGVIVTTWDCRATEVLGGGYFQLDVKEYNHRADRP